GIAYHKIYKQIYVTVQNTHSVLLLDINGKPYKKLPGMDYKYPGSIVTFKKHKVKNANTVRGIAVDINLNLLFVANEGDHKIYVYDINNNFKNIYNIEYNLFQPVGVTIGLPYYNNTLFVTDKFYHIVLAYHINKNNYTLLWISKNNQYLQHPAGCAISQDV